MGKHRHRSFHKIHFPKELSGSDSDKLGIRIICHLRARDQQIVMGKILTRKHMQYSEVPENDMWRLSVIPELADKNMDLPGVSESEVQDIQT